MAQNVQPQDETYACDLHDPPNDALTRLPIPPLLADLSNYYAWQHALYFHLRYNGIFYFLTGHEQSRWDLRWHEAEGNEASRPTYFDRRNYMRRNMHAYSILFSKIGNLVPRLVEAGWDGDRDSFGFRTDLLWNRIQELRQRQGRVPAQQPGREQHQDQVQAQGRMVNGVNGHMANGIHPSQAIDVEDDEME